MNVNMIAIMNVIVNAMINAIVNAIRNVTECGKKCNICKSSQTTQSRIES